MAAMAVTGAFPVKVSVPSSASLRSFWKGASLLNPPRIHFKSLGSSGSSRLSLCARAEVREPAAFTEPEILPSEPNSTINPQFFEHGEVTEAEFTEVSEIEAPQQQQQQQQAYDSTQQQRGYDASQQQQGYDASQQQQAYDSTQQQQGYDASQGQEPSEYDAQYEMDGGQYGEYEGYEQEGSEEYNSQYYDQSQYTPGQYDESQYNHNQFEYANSAAASNVETEQAPAEPPPHYENEGKVMKFIAVGRAMQLKMDSQKDFERFLDHCNAYGVMIPEKPGDIKRNLCELDPKETWIVVDSRAVLKFAKKLALEEAEKNKDYPPGFVENMLNRDKYGRYKSDDD